MQNRNFKFFALLLGLAIASRIPALAADAPLPDAPPAAPATLPVAPAGLRLFLLIGQSNMAGRGKIEAQDQLTNPHIWMLNKELAWVPAKDPLHFDKPVAGVGLASEFARTLVKNDPTLNIGLIPCAVGGTSLDQWNVDGPLYKNAITRATEALKQGTLAGILWHQGEADSNAAKEATYPARFSAMIGQLRQDLNAPHVPLLVGELGRFRENLTTFNAMLPELVKQVPHCDIVSSEGLVDKGDKTHFDSPSLRTFGQRYAAGWLALAAASPPLTK